MGLWQIFDADGVAQDDQFDDGLSFQPSEDGYSTDAVAAHAASLGEGFTFGLICVPGWHVRVEAEQRALAETEQARADAAAQAERDATATAQAKRVAEAELDALLDPSSVARGQINAKFDAMLAALPDRSTDIAKLREAALAEITQVGPEG